MILFPDLSSNNGSVDFKRMRAGGIEACYLKATEGATYQDEPFVVRRREAKAAGVQVGAYHFARPDIHPGQDGARREARNFLRAFGNIRKNELRPCLDFEVGTPGHDASAAWVRAFNEIVRERVGLWPLLYSYPYFIEAMKLEKPLSNGLWLASYGKDDGYEHPYSVPKPWKKAIAHQFSSRARVVGVAGLCDLSSAPSIGPLEP